MSLLIAMLAAMRGGAVMGQSKELVQRRYDNVWINRPGHRRMAVACVGVKIKAKTLGGKKSGVATTRSCGRNACENSFWLTEMIGTAMHLSFPPDRGVGDLRMGIGSHATRQVSSGLETASFRGQWYCALVFQQIQSRTQP